MVIISHNGIIIKEYRSSHRVANLKAGIRWLDYFEKISWDPACRLPWHHVVLVEGSGDQFTNLTFSNFDNVLIGFYSADSFARYSVLLEGFYEGRET